MAEDNYKTVKDWLLSVGSVDANRGGSAFSMIITKSGQINVVQRGACHASMGLNAFGSNVAVEYIAAGFLPHIDNLKTGELFWEWISSTEGPWKKITKHGIELIRTPAGVPCGWIIGEEAYKAVPFEFIKNFAIISRMIAERATDMNQWAELVKKGMHPADAFLFMTYMSIEKGYAYDRAAATPEVGPMVQGSHWPISDSGTKIKTLADGKPLYLLHRIDMRAFRSGEIHTEDRNAMMKYDTYNHYHKYNRINGFFEELESPPDRTWFKLQNFVTNTEGGQSRFSTVNKYPVNDAIDGFYKWLDSEGMR